MMTGYGAKFFMELPLSKNLPPFFIDLHGDLVVNSNSIFASVIPKTHIQELTDFLLQHRLEQNLQKRKARHAALLKELDELEAEGI